MKTFPTKDEIKNKNVANEIFGNRFYADQSLYEYLIEFLLVFSSYKHLDDVDKGKFRFHNKSEKLEYYPETLMGLRRFIFFDSSKKDNSAPIDEKAYNLLLDELKEKCDVDYDKDEFISIIQDLFRGYSVILKKRTWCAQQILPICQELIFCEAMPNLKERLKLDSLNLNETTKIDSSFQFAQRNFLARGGELYYLHILQALFHDEDNARTEKLELLLKKLLTTQSTDISSLARFIQNTWYEAVAPSNEKIADLYQKLTLDYIPEKAYISCESHAVDELINYLSNDFQQIEKIEILAKGIMFQIMRMMYSAVCEKLNISRNPWIVDISNGQSYSIKQISSKSFRAVEDDFKSCVNLVANEMGYKGKDLVKRIKEGQKHSLEIFRSKGKEMRCIIPLSGSFERFTLSEDLLRFLVLSLVEPKEKVTYDEFLDRLYNNFGIVVGPSQYEKSIDNLDADQLAVKNNLIENQKYFQDFLKFTGFLKELSDSTSLVYNSYSSVI